MVSGTQRSWLTAPALLGIAAFWVTIVATRVVSTGWPTGTRKPVMEVLAGALRCVEPQPFRSQSSAAGCRLHPAPVRSQSGYVLADNSCGP